MRVLGMISGTSHDGIDIAICDFSPRGDELAVTVEHVSSTGYAASLRSELVAALPPAAVSLHDLTRLDTLIGQAFADAAADALSAHRARGGGPVDAICSHGQTVYHWVDEGRALGTLQLGQPAWIVERTGLPVVSDVRAADLAAGGQGAPLVCLLDQLVLAPLVSASSGPVAALNLGGISNLTVCRPGADPYAFDIGPANALVDAVVAADPSTDASFDEDGALAAAGSVVIGLLDVLLAEPYYRQDPPKSTGKELFHLEYVRDAIIRWGGRASLPDLVATLVELTARTVADAVAAAGVTRVLASGGGVRNPVLLQAIQNAVDDVTEDVVRVGTTAEVGLDPDCKEAIAFALIGWCTLHGLPGNVPSCTGASGPRVLGRVSPSPTGGLPLGTAVAPRSIVMVDGVGR
jgi:anhydro-N-acetylmuramic acid kinase